MKFSLIIPTLGRKVELSRCLDSIGEQKAEYEVIVMDQNPPGFGLRELCEGRRDVRHFSSDILGLSVNRNIALELATGDWIIFADDDCVLADDFLVKVGASISKDAGSAGIYFTDVRNLEDGDYYTFKLTEADDRLGYGNFKKIPSIGFIFSRETMRKLGGFDVLLGVGAKFGSGEDTDILLRALSMGISARRIRGCSIFHPRMSRAANLDRGKKYALGYGALFAKHLLIQPWKRKPQMALAWLALLARNVGGIVLNVWRPRKAKFYGQTLAYKLLGYSTYLFLHAGRNSEAS